MLALQAVELLQEIWHTKKEKARENQKKKY
jgi:hypothetical protein